MDDLKNFESTLKQLKNYLAIPILNDRDRSGIIQAFEFTFEQCWKAIQKRAGKEGVNIASPKQAFTHAMASGWIPKDKEQLWLKMIEDRNLTTHTYKEDLALEVTKRISDIYLHEFSLLLSRIKQL